MTGTSSDDDGTEYTVRVAENIAAIESDAWDALATPALSKEALPHPFTRHAFLSSLEDAGCVGGRTGWLPQHLLLEDRDGRLLAAVPAYLKGHSQGEYVFDHGWADAFERAGGRYYPKLQISVPFTPVAGPRLLVGAEPGAAVRRDAMIGAIRAYIGQTGVSSAHATFLEDADLAPMLEANYLIRSDQQFHFINRGYATYDDFLGTLASRKRKVLKRERREATENGITIEHLTGADLTEAAWDAFFAFYMDTGSRKWGRPYLNRRFFTLLGERMGESVLLVMARRDGRYIAGALNLIGPDRIYGRYWGCIEEHPFLHFEVCYHQAIDYAIAHGLSVVEAGAQGDHKLARGYEPVLTYSAHAVVHPGLRHAIADYLESERREVERVSQALAEHTPYRREDPDA